MKIKFKHLNFAQNLRLLLRLLIPLQMSILLELPLISNSILGSPNSKPDSNIRDGSYLNSFLHLGIYNSFSHLLNISSLLSIVFQWDQAMTSHNLDLSPLNERVCTSRTSMHTFKTTYGTVPMIPG